MPARPASPPPRRSPPASGSASTPTSASTWPRQVERADACRGRARARSPSAHRSPAAWRTRGRGPTSGLRTWNLGPSGLKVQVQPPIASAAGDRDGHHRDAERDDGPEQRRRPAEQLRGHRVVAQRLGAVEAKRARRATRAASPRRAAPATTSSAPPPAMAAKWPRSRERATWPSARAFSSLRGEAGRFLSWAELEAMRRLFQRRWQT